MANARIQELLARRSPALYGSGKIRLLSPSNNSISNIAKSAATSQLSVMTDNYNKGLVSNADFKAFLQKMIGTPGISPQDKNDIQNQIDEFDARVQGDQLKSAYNAAPDNSLAQYQASLALSSYYKARAGSVQPGTPAYQNYVDSASQYDQAAQKIQDNIQVKTRQNQRYILEQKVNQIPSGTAENAQAKADMWKQLHDQAIADGDVNAANQYAANYQQELTNSQTIQTRESDKANKKQLSDYINTTLNDYHDGKISGDQAVAQLDQASSFAADIGDTSTQVRLNSLYQTITREIDKGVTYSNQGNFGTKTKGGGTGSGGGDVYLNPDGSVSLGGGRVSTRAGGTKSSTGTVVAGTNIGTSGDRPRTLTELDMEYKNNLLAANKALVQGLIPASSSDPNVKSYTQYIMLATKDRQIQLQNITKGLQEIIDQNPEAKIGKKKVADILSNYTKELGSVTGEYNGIRTGNLVLTMKTGTFMDPAGNKIAGNPTIDFVPKAQVAGGVNVDGIYYKPRVDNATFGLDQKAQAQAFMKANPGSQLNQDAQGYYVTDASGKQLSRQFLDVTDLAGNNLTYELDPKYGYLPVAVGPKTGALRNQLIKEADQAAASGQTYTPKILNYNQLISHDFKAPVGTMAPKPAEVKPPGILDQAGKAVSDVAGAAGNVLAPVVKQVEQTVSHVLPPQVPQPQAPISLAGAVPQVTQNLQRALPQTQAKPIQIAPPPLKGAPIVTNFKPAAQVGITPQTKISLPPMSLAPTGAGEIKNQNKLQPPKKQQPGILSTIVNFGKGLLGIK